MTEQSTPTPTDEVDLGALLDALFYDRGNVVTNWPEDEAEAYREFRWAEGDAAARKLVVSKAVTAVHAAGWKSPAEVAELRKLIEQIKQVCSDQLADYHNDDNAEMMSGRNSMADAILELVKEATQ